MAQVLQFGRAGLASASGGDGLQLELAEDGWAQEGDKVTARMVVRQQSSDEDSKALAGQVNGYGPDNPDEPVIPVTWSRDSSIDGFYRVLQTSIEPEVTGRRGSASESGKNTAYLLKADLMRVRDWQAPRVEVVLDGNVRDNDHSVVIGSTLPRWSSGVGAYAVNADADYVSVSTTGAEGAVATYEDASPTDYTSTHSFAVAPGNYYKGCSRIEVSYDSGTSWRTVTGRQITNLPTRARVQNSLVRATTTTTSSVTELSCEWHDGSQWDTAKVFRLTADTSYNDLARAPVAVTVLHNRPEMVGIRLELGASSATTQVYLDVTLYRGSRVIECYVFTVTGTAPGVKLTSAEAATDITGGIRATNVDASGNRFVLATPTTIADTDNTNGRIRIAAATFPFAIANSVGGDTGLASNLVAHYLAAVSWKQAVNTR